MIYGGSAWESNPHSKALKPLCQLGFLVINLCMMHDSARQVLHLLLLQGFSGHYCGSIIPQMVKKPHSLCSAHYFAA
jgi:hypothetical protein